MMVFDAMCISIELFKNKILKLLKTLIKSFQTMFTFFTTDIQG